MKSYNLQDFTHVKGIFLSAHRTTKNKSKNHGGQQGSSAGYFMGASFSTNK